jgi:glycosyltransferase involved in cell wall biosynthesis
MGPLVSIVINNFNYARFLPGAIESALGQTYSPMEIIVVDDGSTDESARIIANYRDDRIIRILKDNGGQASALNAGVARSRGDIICFLDSDDLYYPDKVTQVVRRFGEAELATNPILVHHLLEILNESGAPIIGKLMGKIHEPHYNLYDFARRYRFIPFHGGPTSSVSINRALAGLLFPLPEHNLAVSADDFIVLGASLVAELNSLDAGLGSYRLHGSNAWFNSDRTKSRTFVKALDDYLNQKLVASNRLPVISFYDSMYYWNQLVKEKRWLRLVEQIAKVSARQCDNLTLVFIYDTIRQIFNSHLREYAFLRWTANVTRSLRHGKSQEST